MHIGYTGALGRVKSLRDGAIAISDALTESGLLSSDRVLQAGDRRAIGILLGANRGVLPSRSVLEEVFLGHRRLLGVTVGRRLRAGGPCVKRQTRGSSKLQAGGGFSGPKSSQ